MANIPYLDVSQWKKDLNWLCNAGLPEGPTFGRGTIESTKLFQRCVGLPESGEVDLATWHAMNKFKDVPLPLPGPTGVPIPEGMKLVLNEEFTGPTLDTNLWTPYHNTYGDGNNEQAVLTPDNVEVSNGTLKIHSRRERATINGKTRDFTSGFLGTREKGNFFPRYGRFEMRAKLPHGQGLWPGFWLRHRDGAGVAEVDVMEYFHSQVPGKTSTTLHLDGKSNVTKNNFAFETPTNTPVFHTWAVDILPSGGDVLFKVYLDGHQRQWRDPVTKLLVDVWRNRAPNWSTRYPGQPLFDIAVNTAVGGNWVGHPDDPLGLLRAGNNFTARCAQGGTPPNSCTSTGILRARFPAVYEVDYVRAFELV